MFYNKDAIYPITTALTTLDPMKYHALAPHNQTLSNQTSGDGNIINHFQAMVGYIQPVVPAKVDGSVPVSSVRRGLASAWGH